LEVTVTVNAQILGKTSMFFIAQFKDCFLRQCARAPDVGRQAVRVEVEKAAIDHVLILLMTS
jgi:hypothetical protein